MKVGYVRVSTIEQNEERQIVQLQNVGVTKFFVDKVSAKSAKRPKFAALQNFLSIKFPQSLQSVRSLMK